MDYAANFMNQFQNTAASAPKKFMQGPPLTIGAPWDFVGTPVPEAPAPTPGLLPTPSYLISPWDTAQQQAPRTNTWTNIYGQQFTTPYQINLSRFSPNPSGNLPLYMNQDIANILATALGY